MKHLFIFFSLMFFFNSGALELCSAVDSVMSNELTTINRECSQPKFFLWKYNNSSLKKGLLNCENLTQHFVKKYPQIHCLHELFNTKTDDDEKNSEIDQKSLLAWAKSFSAEKRGEGVDYGRCSLLVVFQYMELYQACRRVFSQKQQLICQEDIQLFLKIYPNINCSFPIDEKGNSLWDIHMGRYQKINHELIQSFAENN